MESTSDEHISKVRLVFRRDRDDVKMDKCVYVQQ